MDTQDKNIGTISRVLFFVCFLFFSFATFGNPLFNGHNDFSSTQQPYGATKKIKQNNLENISDNSSICESTISCVAPDCKELVDFKTKVPLLDICNSKEEISSLFVEQLYSDSFYLLCSQYVTKQSNTTIDFSIYSRYEISDWLYNIGKISLSEKLDLYYSFFLNRLFENEICLTNHLYVMDPTSDLLNVNGIDYDDDSGSGFNASITRYLLSTHIYNCLYAAQPIFIVYQS